MAWLEALHADYNAWLASQTIDMSDVTHDYRIPPSCTMDFVSYAALPFRVFDDAEIQAIWQFLADGPRSDAERAVHRYVSHVVTARFTNLSNRKLQDDVEILSIGSDCLPRILFSKWGLQRTKIFGKLSYPFDLALVQPKAALRLVTDDFDGLLDPSAMSMLADYEFPFNRNRGTIFNHEAGKEWVEDDFGRLIALYKRRIRDFRITLANDRRKLFLFNYCDLFNGDAERFFNLSGMSHKQPFDVEAQDLLVSATKALSNVVPGRIGVLCVITGYAGPEAPVEQVAELAVGDALVRVIRIPRPTSTYTFYDPVDYSAESGLEFERGIVDAVGALAYAILPAMPAISSGVEIARC